MEYVSASIVVVGSMNPAIFSPAWLRHWRIINEEEIAEAERPPMLKIQKPEKASDEVLFGVEPPRLFVTPHLARIQGKTFVLLVEPERYTIETASANSFNLLPAVTGRIFQQLSHTPIRAFGVNFHAESPLPESTAAEDKLRQMFAADTLKLDTVLGGANWDIEARVTSRATNPRTQIVVASKPDSPKDLAVRANFHYDLGAGESLSALVGTRFPKDREAFERMVEAILR